MSKILIIAANVGIAVGGYGGSERSLRLAESMPNHDVTVLMSSLSGEDYSRDLRPNLRFVSVPEDRHLATQIFQYARREFAGNLDVATYALFNKFPRMRAEIQSRVAEADLVILDHVGCVGLIKNIEINVPVLYAAHNCEYDLASQMYPNSQSIKDKVFAMESTILQKSTATTFCSMEDLDKIENHYGIIKQPFYIPNGTDQQKQNRNNYQSKDIIFIGSGHGPNVDAAKSVIKLAEKMPEYKFHIIGKCGDSIDKASVPDNYIIHGFLSDTLMNLLFENAFAFINPMKAGSGTHLKVMRSLSYGLPIISSTTGLRGFSTEELSSGLLEANNDEEIMAKIVMLQDQKFYQTVSDQTYELSKPYLWPVIQKDFAEVVDHLLENSGKLTVEAEKKKVLIYSIIRNNANTMDRYYDQIRSIVSGNSDHEFFLSIYENDSTDDTKKKIFSKDWSFLSGVSIVSENIDTQHFGSVKSEERVKNLAIARNKAIESGGFLDSVDYVLMVEGDNYYSSDDVKKLLNFGTKEEFDIVSALSLRPNNTHYDWWATRTSAVYKPGSSEVPRNFKQYEYGPFYSTSNGLCLYKAEPFRKGARHGWINLETGKFDCEMVVLCQEFRKLGYGKVFVNYKSLSRHD